MKNRIIQFVRGSFLLSDDSRRVMNIISEFTNDIESVDRKIHNIAQINESVKSLRSEFVDTRTILIRYKMESTVSKKIYNKMKTLFFENNNN